MKHGNNGHTYLFSPGRWVGKGVLSIIGGSSEPIGVSMIVSQGGTGTITAHLELEFSETHREGGLEVVYTVSPKGKDTFDLMQHHSKLGRLVGKGAVTKQTILITFRSDDGTYSGFEAMEKVDAGHYHVVQKTRFLVL